MPYDHAATKRLSRRVVHDTMAVDANYYDDTLAKPVALRVRWHNKMSVHGDLDKDGYSSFIDSVDRVIFDIDELLVKGIQIVRGATITMTAKGFAGQILHIDTQDNTAGPGEEIWLVGKG